MSEPTKARVTEDLERIRADVAAIFDDLDDKSSEDAKRLINAAILINRARKYISGEYQQAG